MKSESARQKKYINKYRKRERHTQRAREEGVKESY